MNESKTEGIFDQAKGKLKQAFGEATDNQSLANEGTADQVKGYVKEAWGDTKDTASDLTDRHTADVHEEAHTEGNSLRDKITHAADSFKDSVKSGLDHLEHKAKD